LGGLTVVAVVVLATTASRSAARQQPPPVREVAQDFPVGGPVQTGWKVRYTVVSPGNGLCITGAWFRRSLTDKWIKVLHDVRLSEIFVPYNNGTRIYDLGARGRFELAPATRKEAGVNGVLLDAFVVKEVRDVGLLWKFY